MLGHTPVQTNRRGLKGRDSHPSLGNQFRPDPPGAHPTLQDLLVPEPGAGGPSWGMEQHPHCGVAWAAVAGLLAGGVAGVGQVVSSSKAWRVCQTLETEMSRGVGNNVVQGPHSLPLGRRRPRVPYTELLRLRGARLRLGGPLDQGTQPCSPTANHILSRKGNWAGRGWGGEGAARPGAERDWAEAGRPLGRLAVTVCPQGAL